MKRGLVESAEGDRAIYETRLDRLQDRMREQDVQVALIYGDVYRSDDIAHLTNLCIYWNEGVVAIPADGEPVFLAKLSKRVHPWMQRTSLIRDLRSSQKLPELIASYLNEVSSGTVGFVDRAWWPAPLLDGIVASAPGREFVDLPEAVRGARLAPDELDRDDLGTAGELVAAGIAAATNAEGSPTGRLAALELAARGGGARDVLAVCREAAGGVQVECAVQFANVWAYAARVIGDEDDLQESLQEVAGWLNIGSTVERLQTIVDQDTTVALVSCVDLATGGDLRPASDTGIPVVPGQAVVIKLSRGDLLVADTYLVEESSVRPVTRQSMEVSQ